MSKAWWATASALIVAIAAALALLLSYFGGGSRHLNEALLVTLLGAFGSALIFWGKWVLPHEEIAEERPPEPSSTPQLEAAQSAFETGQEEITRRIVLTSLLSLGAGALALVALLPLRSLGPRPGKAFFHTAWRAGLRLVKDDGKPVNAKDLQEGAVITVFPEGHVGDADAQAMLVRVRADQLQLPADREAWAPLGYVAYSKVCTHVGCPVALYRRETHELRCPCHQSTFDVLRGAAVLSGPAPRPLPQLPLTIGSDGWLRARGDFPEPVGPSFWTRA